MIGSYNDLYETVLSAVESYSKEDESAEIVFEKNDNGTCSMTNKLNGSKFVLMFARYGDEYKVGFALYVTDAYGGMKDPEWIEDIFNHEFDEKFIHILIAEHLVKSVESNW